MDASPPCWKEYGGFKEIRSFRIQEKEIEQVLVDASRVRCWLVDAHLARNCQRRGNRRAIVETLFARCHHNGSRSLSSKIIMVGSLDGKLRYSNVKIVRFKSKVMSSIGFRPLHHPWGNVSIRCSATQNDGCVKFKPVVFLVRSQTCVEQFMPNSLSLIERWCLATVSYILYQRKYIPSGSLPNENDALDCKRNHFQSHYSLQ